MRVRRDEGDAQVEGLRDGGDGHDLLDGAPLEDLTQPTVFHNLYLVPSKPDLAGAVVELARRDDGERYLAYSLAAAGRDFSFVFLDCPPSLGPLTVNALAAADRVLVPVQAEYYALEGLSQLLRSVDGGLFAKYAHRTHAISWLVLQCTRFLVRGIRGTPRAFGFCGTVKSRRNPQNSLARLLQGFAGQVQSDTRSRMVGICRKGSVRSGGGSG